jgi:hypothetical protein
MGPQSLFVAEGGDIVGELVIVPLRADLAGRRRERGEERCKAGIGSGWFDGDLLHAFEAKRRAPDPGLNSPGLEW